MDSSTPSGDRSGPISPMSTPPAPTCSRARPMRRLTRRSNTRASRRSSAPTRHSTAGTIRHSSCLWPLHDGDRSAVGADGNIGFRPASLGGVRRLDTVHALAVVLEAGDPGWHKIQSVFSWVRIRRGSVATAYTLQAAVTLAVGVTLIRLWRSNAPFALKAAALCLWLCWLSLTDTTTT